VSGVLLIFVVWKWQTSKYLSKNEGCICWHEHLSIAVLLKELDDAPWAEYAHHVVTADSHADTKCLLQKNCQETLDKLEMVCVVLVQSLSSWDWTKYVCTGCHTVWHMQGLTGPLWRRGWWFSWMNHHRWWVMGTPLLPAWNQRSSKMWHHPSSPSPKRSYCLLSKTQTSVIDFLT
jgi:hypothetical protein